MKRMFIFGLLMYLLQYSFLSAQEEPKDDEILPPKRSAAPKIGGAAGFTPQWLFVDIDPINQVLNGAQAAPFNDGRLMLSGGQGYGYVLFIPNLRIGGMGAGGRMTSKSLSGNTRRDVELSVSLSGVTLDYVVPVMPRLDLSFGMLLGKGSMDLKITRDDGGAKVWDDLWNQFGSLQPAQEYSRKLSGSFFVVQPSVNIEFSLLRWVGLRAGVSYVDMSGGDWTMDDKYDIYGVPSNISGKGWMINTGIFIGTFVY